MMSQDLSRLDGAAFMEKVGWIFSLTLKEHTNRHMGVRQHSVSDGP